MFICFPTYQKTAKPLSYGAIRQQKYKSVTGYILSRFGLTGTVSTTAGQRTRQRHCRLSYKTGLATIQKAGHKGSTTART